MAQLTISDKLKQDLDAIVASSAEFKFVDDYVSYILQQVVTKKQATTPSSAATYSKADEDKIRERLKNLGYLD